LHAVPAGNIDGAVVVVFIAAFATVGALLAWKRPGNTIGWLLFATGLAYAVGVSGVLLLHFPRTLTLANWLGWIWLLGIELCVFAVLLYPAGNLPSRRWRPVAWAAGAGLAGWVLGCVFAPTIITVSPSVRNPVGVTGPAGDIFKIMVAGGGVLIAATGLAAVLSLAFRYRRVRSAERAQLKWLVYATVLVVAALFAEVPIEWVMGPGDAATNLQNATGSGAVALVAVATGIAVLRYRLYDIDRGHLSDRGLRDRDRPAGRDLRRAGAAGHPGVRLAHTGGGGRLHAGGGVVQSAAPTRLWRRSRHG